MKRSVETLKYDFKFQKFDLDALPQGVFERDFDDSSWRTVRVPHDWGVEGDFDVDNDPTVTIVKEDGMVKETVMTGWNGGLPVVGMGVYRKWIEIEKADRVFLELDGVMWESKVYLNGREMGGYHFGYGSYEVELTEAVDFEGPNLLAILAIVRPNAGRWYTGAGIYRNLRLVRKDEQHIKYNGTWIRQVYCDKKLAVVDITLETAGVETFTAEITAPNGDVATYTSEGESLIFNIENPALWDVEAPNLYQAKITLPQGDCVEIPFGVRMIEFTKEGFFLNGRYLQMKGVCMHHDLGMLGAAMNRSALKRQLEILRGMGVDSIRTSHNPPAPELLELCDEMGFLVMDEFFDEWILEKVKNGYSSHFAAHAEADVIATIKRDRNHPSVVMWSIGNEVRDQSSEDGWKRAKMLSDAVHRTDPTRPTTGGYNSVEHSFNNRLAFYTDIVGLNYRPHQYQQFKDLYPEKLFIGSETESCVSTRGVYHLPAKIDIPAEKQEDLAVSAYELSAPSWAYYAEREIAAQKDHPFVMGEFIWTGFDYMGEPTPYYTEWPSRSSYFGAIDLAGLPKNRYYCYRSAWTDIPTLHIFPHWNWEGHEGEHVPVHAYTNYEEAELFVNGISQGKRRYWDGPHGEDEKKADKGAHLGRYRMMWDDVIYQPGEITIVAYEGGEERMRKTVKTAGAPHHIELTAYKGGLTADGEAMEFITASILDAEGNLCPHANHRLTFKVEGAAEFIGTDAGDQREVEGFFHPDKKALAGMLVCGIRATKESGNVIVSCFGEGFEECKITLESK